MANWEAAREFLRGQSESFALKPFHELAVLDELIEMPAPEHLRPFQLILTRTVLPDGSLAIRFDAWLSYFFGLYSRKVTDGFVISPGGSRRELSPDEALA